jgi:hypothetical protein
METPKKTPETRPENSRKDGRGKSEGSRATQKRGHMAVQEGRAARRAEDAQVMMPDDPGAVTLAAMRHVAHMPESRDTTPLHVAFRKLLDTKPAAFAEKLVELEGKAALGKDKVAGAGVDDDRPCRNCGFDDSELDEDGNPPVDPGSERVLRLIETWQEGQRKTVAEENAGFAKRPDAAPVAVARSAALMQAVREEQRLLKRLEQFGRKNDDFMFKDFYVEQAVKAAALVGRPNPVEHASELQHELDASQERQRILTEKIRELEPARA